MIYAGFGAKYAAIQTMTFSREALLISSRRCQTAFCTYYNSMTMYVCSPGAKLACLHSRSTTLWKHLDHQIKYDKETLNCWAAGILYRARIGQGLLSPPNLYRVWLKEEVVEHRGKQAPVLFFFFFQIQNANNFREKKTIKIDQFQHYVLFALFSLFSLLSFQ